MGYSCCLAVLQAEVSEADTAAVSSLDCQAVNAHLSAEELTALCEKLEKDLAAPPQVRLGNMHAKVLGQPAAYQV